MPGPPRYGTPFVGREDLSTQLASALDRTGGAWTLAGPGGVGKSRLAAAIASQWTGSTWWVDLQSVRDPAGLVRALSHGMDLGAQSDAVEMLAARGRALLVLDNFEQIVDSCAGMVDDWLSSAPSLRVLVTSRETLRIRAERVVEVQPLPKSHAAAVFLGAAPFLFDGASADPELMGSVLGILEGLPLALELAAARLDVMTLDQLKQRLADPLAVLQDPSRAHTRHGGLESAVAWSWDLLSEAERSALGQCAVFRGGFTLAAAEAVVEVQGASVMDLIHRLRQRRLLTFDGQRFAMLEVIRRFAATAWDQRPVGLRHGAYYSGIGSQYGEQVETAGAGAALDTLTIEYDNLRAVLDGESIPDALNAGVGLGAVLEHRGPVQAQIPVINRVLEICPEDSEFRPVFLRQRASYLLKRGLGHEAEVDLRAALQQVEANPISAAKMRVRLADLHVYLGEIETARQEYEQARVEATGDPALQASVLIQLAVMAHDDGQPNEATRLEAEALTLARLGKNPFREAKVLGLMAAMATERFDLETSQGYLSQALAIFEALGIPRSIAFTTGQLGVEAEVDGELSAAEGYYFRAVEGAKAARDERLLGSWLGSLGRVHVKQGNLELGRPMLLGAIEILERAGMPRMVSGFDAALSSEAAARADVDAAQRHEERIPEAQAWDKAEGRVAVEVARCKVAASNGDSSKAATHLAKAREILASTPGDGSSYRQKGMAHVIGHALADTEAWVVAEDGSWFRVPGGETVEVGGVHARVLARLLRMHRVDDAQIEDLMDAGWPDERISEAAATNRVYVALTALRKLGIRPLLKNARPGWRLDPDATIRHG